jgi:hypothetical protein
MSNIRCDRSVAGPGGPERGRPRTGLRLTATTPQYRHEQLALGVERSAGPSHPPGLVTPFLPHLLQSTTVLVRCGAQQVENDLLRIWPDSTGAPVLLLGPLGQNGSQVSGEVE